MSNEPPRIVIDTNVLISAGLLPRSRSAWAVATVVETFVLAQNRATWEELVSRIERPKFDRYFGENGRLAYLAKLAQVAQFFDAAADVRISRDADDDKFVSLALDVGATLIMSGDGELKDIQTYQGIEIVSPSVFLQRFAPSR